MAAVSNSIVHLTMRFGSTVLSIGTGVIYERDSQYFIVTAWHNVTGRHSETLKPLNSQGALPDNIVVSIAVNRPGIGVSRHQIILPLFDEEKALFYIHPENWPRVDVVVVPFDPMAYHDFEIQTFEGEVIKTKFCLIDGGNTGIQPEICPIQKYQVPDKILGQRWLDTVEVTEELFIPGYPHNIQDYYSQPVWKRATIASSVQLGWNDAPKFLIDSASTSGMSGSPVLYYSPNGVVRIWGGTHYFSQEVAILVGIYVGRIGIEKDADPQIGTVWHQSVIDEIIEGNCYERSLGEIELSSCELKEEAKISLSSCSRKGIENIKNSRMPSRFYIRENLLKQINGRASPERALDAVIEAAETYDGPLAPDEDS
jgi:hypothetical protein